MAQANQNKKKSNARQHAQNRAQSQRGLSAAPKVPTSIKEVGQSRFPGETPLTGEDRPADRAGHKQQGHSGPGATRRSAARTPSGAMDLPDRRGRRERRRGDERE